MKKQYLLAVPALVGMIVAGAAATTAGAAPTARQAPAASYTLITEPDQTYTPVYNFIATATKTLDMTMYELVDTTAEQDLAAAAKKGVKVRVILDQNLEKSSNTTAFNYLNANGVSTVWAKSGRTTHQKTITVDGTSSLIMTGNLTSRYYSTTRDFGVIDTNSLDVNSIEKVFNADYANTAITPTDGDSLVWSPTDSQTQLLALINGATKTLNVENEEMSDTAIVSALENAAKKGVDVTITMTNTSNEYASEFDALKAAGAHVSTYTGETPIYIHAKAIVADGAKVYVGSENFSNASLNSNRELGMITTDASVLSSVNSTLTSDFNGATPWS
ncbi:MAG TPA: phospholipase D-like domain-containing protein [Pseudonocardiaceae bacterium]|nr:phospholipase D-like domain-containing protein [Pseudonocardiaceae bacterium]